MLGKTEGKRRSGQQRMRWLDSITDSMDMRDREGQGSLVCCSSWGHKESDTTEWPNNGHRQCGTARPAGPLPSILPRSTVLPQGSWVFSRSLPALPPLEPHSIQRRKHIPPAPAPILFLQQGIVGYILQAPFLPWKTSGLVSNLLPQWTSLESSRPSYIHCTRQPFFLHILSRSSYFQRWHLLWFFFFFSASPSFLLLLNYFCWNFHW